MSFIANVIWFLLGGAALALFCLIMAGIFCLTIIGIPIGRACFEFAKLTAFPFGKKIVREADTRKKKSGVKAFFNVILNIIWFGIGLVMTIIYFVYGILSCITIIGIPVGIVYFKMGKFLLFPIGARVEEK